MTRYVLLSSISLISCVGLCACSGRTAGAGQTAPADLGIQPDYGPFADLAPQPPDLAYTGTLFHYVVSHVDLPASKGEYGFDENGDNTVDNRLATLLSAMLVNTFSFMQAQENIAVSIDGDALALISLATMDASEMNDPTALTTLYVGTTQKFPDVMTGTGMFAIDASGGAGKLSGLLAGGVFTGADPARQSIDITASLRLGFVSTQSVTLPLHGAHIDYSVTADGLMSGKIDGVVTAADVTNILIPSLAANFSLIEAAMPCDADCTNVMKLLDLDGDGQVSVKDLMQGPLDNSLTPDVDMFDAMNRYAPNPSNTNPDAWSIGVGFSAVKAVFTEP